MQNDIQGLRMTNDELILACVKQRWEMELTEFQLWELREEVDLEIQKLRRGIDELSDRVLARKFDTTPTRVRRTYGLAS